MATTHTPSNPENNCCQLVSAKTNCFNKMLEDNL